jgi:acetate kinase
MKLLVLRPTPRSLDYACFSDDRREPLLAASLRDYRGSAADRTSLLHALQKIQTACAPVLGQPQPDGIAIATRFGGEIFGGPTLLNAEAIKQLKSLIPQAPMDLPGLLELIHAGRQVFPGVPEVMLFETAFFTRLPPRERMYGLNRELARTLHVRRYGYHGLFHEAACSFAASTRAARGCHSPARVLSICLEPHPEVSAVIGQSPVTVSSGATPLEGIPGHTTCGELDPGTILILAKEQNWGPEQINRLLTQQSGLLGLAGRPETVEEVLLSDDPELALARSVLQYRILQSCGAGMAAMGGFDTMVFSGRFSKAGTQLGPWLLDRLSFRGGNRTEEPRSILLCKSIERVIADLAIPTFLNAAADEPVPAA